MLFCRRVFAGRALIPRALLVAPAFSPSYLGQTVKVTKRHFAFLATDDDELLVRASAVLQIARARKPAPWETRYLSWQQADNRETPPLHSFNPTPDLGATSRCPGAPASFWPVKTHDGGGGGVGINQISKAARWLVMRTRSVNYGWPLPLGFGLDGCLLLAP